jgi:hypothetical protein
MNDEEKIISHDYMIKIYNCDKCGYGITNVKKRDVNWTCLY